MPTGPQDQQRPHSTGACAVHVMRIAAGEIEEHVELPPLPRPKRGDMVRNGGGDDEPPLLGSGLPPPPHKP